MTSANINIEILAWARNRAGFSLSDLAKKINTKYEQWETGRLKPTFKQAQEIAKKLHIPFGYLYLSQPPETTNLTADLRTLGDEQNHEFSVDLQDVLADAIRKQDWYREYLIENGAEKLDFVAKYKETDASKTIADDITKTLSLELDDRNELTKDQFLRHLTQQTEEKGILVLRNGKVGLNTKRILDVEEFRGFALIDPIAPLIFINTADFIAAQIFTFAHELAHIWIGRGGVSNASLINDIDYSLVENVCNTVAAEVLVPQEKFKELWDYNNTDFHEQAENLSRTFKVSSVVIARRALDMELISKEIFFEYYKTLQNIWRKVKKRKESGANFHSTFPLLNSRKFTDAVCNEIYSDRLLMREGMALLGTSKYQTIDNYAKEKGLI